MSFPFSFIVVAWWLMCHRVRMMNMVVVVVVRVVVGKVVHLEKVCWLYDKVFFVWCVFSVGGVCDCSFGVFAVRGFSRSGAMQKHERGYVYGKADTANGCSLGD